jgi:16S rRNA processing protein RimM
VTGQQSQLAARVTVARIVRPHGRRGEVAAEILTDFPERLKRLRSVELFDGRAHANVPALRHVKVISCWLSHSRGGQAIFHFEGSNSISDAEKLVGFEVQIPFTERMKLPASSHYISDLIGCEVREKSGAVVGTVRDVEIIGGQVTGTPLLTVDSPDGEILIPLAQEICVRVDTKERLIEVILPEGLRELNRNS